MSELTNDLKTAMKPEYLCLASDTFRNEAERRAYIATKPAKRVILSNIVEPDGTVIWKK